VGGVAPPGQHIGFGEHLFGESVVGVLQSHDADVDIITEVLLDASRHRSVHAVRVALRHVGFLVFVDVIAPDCHLEHVGVPSPM
jgi:hypothetical protein